jgi:hypothetical protein
MKISKKSMLGVFCLLAMFVAVFLWRGVVPANLDVVPVAQAQADSGSRRCSTRTLNGAYGIKFEGQKLNEGPFVSVSRITFNGTGQFTTNEIGRFNGNLVQRSFPDPTR